VADRKPEHLRVLIANQPRDPLALVRRRLETLGHHVITPRLESEDIAAVIAQARPDVALVTIGDDARHALVLIEQIVLEAACPVIALVDAPDPEHLREAAKRGVFAYVADRNGENWQSAIDIGLRRFSDFHRLEAAFGRRAVIERAKGILMERHGVDEANAFGLLRKHSRTTNRRLIDIAGAVADGHALLPGPRGPETGSERVPLRVTRSPHAAKNVARKSTEFVSAPSGAASSD
jgi:AmiR/NasT family two-component response regulator